MKQLVRHAAAVLLSTLALSSATAQTTPAIPNAGLEDWKARNSVEAPDNWLTTDDGIRATDYSAILPLIGGTTGTVTKSTTRHGGSFAVQLQTKNVQIISAVLGPVPGVLALGTKLKKISTTTLTTLEGLNNVGSGVPYTDRPTQLQFYYRLTGTAADMAGAGIGLFKTVNGMPQPVASGALVLTPTTGTDFQLATVPLTYTSTETPDTLRIAFFSGSAPTRTEGTTLLIDDIALIKNVATPTHASLASAGLNVYPNPSTSGTFALQANEAALAASAYTVFDAVGRQVRHVAAVLPVPGATRTIDLQGQKAGVYTLLLETARGPLVQKLVIP